MATVESDIDLAGDGRRQRHTSVAKAGKGEKKERMRTYQHKAARDEDGAGD